MSIPPTRPLGRAVQRVAATATFARLARRVAPATDRLMFRLTGGRVLPASTMVPTIMLTTTGARSGRARTVPLATVAEPDGSFLVVGSNFGQAHHPAWSTNLLRNPDAVVVHRRHTVAVQAVLLEGEAEREAWPRLLSVWPAYSAYMERAGDRHLRVFRLEPVGHTDRVPD